MPTTEKKKICQSLWVIFVASVFIPELVSFVIGCYILKLSLYNGEKYFLLLMKGWG